MCKFLLMAALPGQRCDTTGKKHILRSPICTHLISLPTPALNTVIRFIRHDDRYAVIFISMISKSNSPYASAFVSAVRADQVGLTGNGVTVAVIDSGIAYHDDFVSELGSWRIDEASTSRTEAVRRSVRAWHACSRHHRWQRHMSKENIRVSRPKSDLINLKVADKDGMTYESDVVEALEWVYNNKDEYNIRVVNLSMNSSVAQSYHTSPLSAAVEILWFNGIVVVVSAGNNGTGEGPVTLYPPANDPFVITVGATEDKGTSRTWG